MGTRGPGKILVRPLLPVFTPEGSQKVHAGGQGRLDGEWVMGGGRTLTPDAQPPAPDCFRRWEAKSRTDSGPVRPHHRRGLVLSLILTMNLRVGSGQGLRKSSPWVWKDEICKHAVHGPMPSGLSPVPPTPPSLLHQNQKRAFAPWV